MYVSMFLFMDHGECGFNLMLN